MFVCYPIRLTRFTWFHVTFLFPNIKEKMLGQHFSQHRMGIVAYNNALSDITEQAWIDWFCMLFQRMETYVSVNEEYLEKL